VAAHPRDVVARIVAVKAKVLMAMHIHMAEAASPSSSVTKQRLTRVACRLRALQKRPKMHPPHPR
jgi:DNA repair protein RadC